MSSLRRIFFCCLANNNKKIKKRDASASLFFIWTTLNKTIKIKCNNYEKIILERRRYIMITIGANLQKISYGSKHYNLDTAVDLEKLNPTGE